MADSEPKNFPQLRVWAQEFAVEARIGLLLKLGLVVLGLLGTLLAAAFTLYNQTSDLKSSLLAQIGEVKKDTAVIEGALKTINERLGRIETDQRDTLAAIVRIEARQVPPTPALVLAPENAELVRTVLAIPPKTTAPGKNPDWRFSFASHPASCSGRTRREDSEPEGSSIRSRRELRDRSG